jgi:hypothetical protein
MNLIEFTDNRGRRMFLPDNATIEDLLKIGVSNIGLSRKDEPLKDNYWASVGPSDPEVGSTPVLDDRTPASGHTDAGKGDL